MKIKSKKKKKTNACTKKDIHKIYDFVLIAALNVPKKKKKQN